MTQNYNCRELTAKMNDLKNMRLEFTDKFAGGDIYACLEIKSKSLDLIKEIESRLWLLEILTEKNIEKQYDEWNETYKDLDPKYELPSKERIFEFLQSDPEFLELMKTKEKQGLTKLIIAPAPGFHSLRDLAYSIVQKIKKNGGGDGKDCFSRYWNRIFSNEEDVRYFGNIDIGGADRPKSTGGVNAEEIRDNPERYGICDGWMVSFTTHERNINRFDEPNLDTGAGRKAIKTSLTAIEYAAKYFSDKDKFYEGERSMIPQENFALFISHFYKNYIKPKKKLTGAKDLFDDNIATWFVDTSLPDETDLPFAAWSDSADQFFLADWPISSQTGDIGARSVVRRSIKS